MKVLFVCSRNKWRSRTAEEIFKNENNLMVRSAGTEPSARIKVSQKHLLWADLIFVMEKKHKQRLQTKFYEEISGKEVINLDILDDYKFMDEELVEILNDSVRYHLEKYL
ncbi:protein tyrosine phosphatase [uncultured Arcticibacterium sp.]|uniref:low molecular weight protein tyrosine phosphatase family protein n=1 Tax=uncultured Arcticibacterium sp. TaxID=2173042 RepID=UPI0030F61693